VSAVASRGAAPGGFSGFVVLVAELGEEVSEGPSADPAGGERRARDVTRMAGGKVQLAPFASTVSWCRPLNVRRQPFEFFFLDLTLE